MVKRKLRQIPKILTSQTRTETVAINILAGISKTKGNQTMEFGQLIEYNVRNIFLQNLRRKDGRVTNSISLFPF